GQSKRAPSHPLERPGKNRHELSEIRNYSIIGRAENIRCSVIINGYNQTRSLNPDGVIESPAHTDSKIKLWSDRLSGKSDLLLAREPARVYDTPACADRHTGFHSRRSSLGPAQQNPKGIAKRFNHRQVFRSADTHSNADDRFGRIQF